MRTEKERKLNRRRTRKRRLRYLRDRLARTTDPAERRRLIAKIQRISPSAPVPEE
jgi:hypothetical protein